MKRLAGFLAALAIFWTATSPAQPFPEGKSQRSIDIAGESIDIHAYKPPGYAGGEILLVLHGLGANAPGYRNYAIPLADRLGYLVIAPLFDRARFPTWRYQTGGIVRDQRTENPFSVEPESRWMGATFLAIIEAVRSAESLPSLAYSMVGHSAGGQTLSRFAAFMPHTARRLIIANPSTHIWPSREERFPYGFGGLPSALSDDTALRRYLAQPFTLLLGTADLRRDNNLNVREGAERQGFTRYERGHNAYTAAKQLAAEKGWAFHWKLIEVPGIGHSARRMLASAEAETALARD